MAHRSFKGVSAAARLASHGSDTNSNTGRRRRRRRNRSRSRNSNT